MFKNITEKIKDIYYWFYRTWKYKVSNIHREIYWFFQRGKRGYADCDIWSFDHYLARVISGGLRKLAKNNHGCPQEFFDENKREDECVKWRIFLEEVASGFDQYEIDIDIPGPERKISWEKENNDLCKMLVTPEVTEKEHKEYIRLLEEKDKKFKENFQRFIEYFGGYWD
jgi:hypothetical protein